MPHPPAYQDRPRYLQWVLKPWLWVALGLHGGLLFLPLPSNPPPEISTVDDVSLVTLSPSPTPPAIPRGAIASPPPTPTATPMLPPTTPLPAPSRPSAPPPLPDPTPALTPLPTPTPTPSITLPSPSPSPEAQPEALPEPQPTPIPQSTVPNPPDFPHILGSQPGCGGQEGCWQIANSRWRTVATTLEQDLKTQGYAIRQLQLADDTGVRIYEVSKAGEASYYLNFVSTLEGTVYVFSNEPLTAQQLNEMVAAQQEA